MDGKAIMISGFNRNFTVTHNEFEWIGESVIASWGYTSSNGIFIAFVFTSI